MRGDYGITYDLDVLRLIDAFQERGLFVGSVCVTMYTAAPEVEAFEKRLNSLGIRTFRHYKIPGYPNDVARIVSDEAMAATSTLRPSARWWLSRSRPRQRQDGHLPVPAVP